MKLNVKYLLNEILPFVLALMTFLTIWISSRTLEEMRRQREDSYRPELYAKDIGLFFIEIDSTNWLKRPSMDSIPWLDATNTQALCNDDLLGKVKSLSDELVFEFTNVGRGPAIDIQVDWIYSGAAIEDYWKSAVGDSDFRHWHLEETSKTKWRWWSNGADCGLVQYRQAAGHESSFILPANQSPKPLQVDVWEEMIFVHLSTIHQGMRKNPKNGFSNIESAHTLNLDYKSLDQTMYRQQFEVTIRTNHAWVNVPGSVATTEYEKQIFRVEVSIESVGKKEVSGYSKDERPRRGPKIIYMNPSEEKLASPVSLVPSE